LCHEALHVALPHLTDHPPKSKAYRKGEAEVDRIGKVVSRILWSQNYRRVVQSKHTTPVRISK
jgi:predicted metal-dependent peptidase